MIELDFDEINQAAAQLLAHVLRYTPERFSADETIAFRTAVFPKLIEFARTDVPCDLKTSIALFEQCLKTSDLANIPTSANFNSVDQDVKIAGGKMDLTPFDLRTQRSSKKQQFEWVQTQILNARKAVTENEVYRPKKFKDDILSIDADNFNEKVFREYFEKIKRDNALYTANPIQLAQYVDPVIEQTRELQNQFKIRWDLSSAVNKRRATNEETEDLGFRGFLTNGTPRQLNKI